MEKTAVFVAPETVERAGGLTARQVLNRLKKIADAERRKAEADAEIKALRAEIVGDADAVSMETPAFIVRYTPTTSNRVDTARLKKLYPDVYAECVAPSTSYRFSYKIR